MEIIKENIFYKEYRFTSETGKFFYFIRPLIFENDTEIERNKILEKYFVASIYKYYKASGEDGVAMLEDRNNLSYGGFKSAMDIHLAAGTNPYAHLVEPNLP